MPSLFILIPIFGIIILNLPLGRLMKKCAFWYAFALFSLQIILAIFHNPFFWSGALEAISTFFSVKFTIDYLGFLDTEERLVIPKSDIQEYMKRKSPFPSRIIFLMIW